MGSGHQEALKAQSVAAITFAIINSKGRVIQGNTSNQEYRDKIVVTKEVFEAVDEVCQMQSHLNYEDWEIIYQGVVVKNDGRLVENMYSATHTNGNYFTEKTETAGSVTSGYDFKGCNYRKALYWSEVSNKFDTNIGHGVDMPQKGARYLATEGYNYEAILKHFYGPIAPYLYYCKIFNLVGKGYSKVYDVYWKDNYNPSNPERTLEPGHSTPKVFGDFKVNLGFSEWGTLASSNKVTVNGKN
jgi:hypothetical protein